MYRKIYYSLPFQLIMLNLRRCRLIMILWALLFSILFGYFAEMYGVPLLFYDPEYLGKVDFYSMLIMGISFGIFTMAYNITVYILESYRFRFLMTLKEPFTRFCLNNSFFPVLFIFIYLYKFIFFQIHQGIEGGESIIAECFGFLLGFHITLILTLAYFKVSEYNIFYRLTQNIDATLRTRKMTRVSTINKLKVIKRRSFHVDYFIDYPLSIKHVDNFVPYDKTLVTKVIDQNHLNAFLLQVTGFLIILALGYFRDYEYVQIPAGASIFILSSSLVMFIGAFTYWLKGWWIYAMIVILIVLNYAMRYNIINPDYQVFGLNYDTTKADYSLANMQYLSSHHNYDNDYKNGINILENWKAKQDTTRKPKLMIIAASGGGQRAAVWTMSVLQKADSTIGGNVLKYATCITGASGGLVGASYFRELYLRKLKGEKIDMNNSKYTENMGKDILNPLVFTLIVNDIFFRYQQFSDGKYNYTKDRGYAFEYILNKNTEGVMNKKIYDYYDDERMGNIPMLFLTPSVVNDGRKMYVSPQPVSYMTNPDFNDNMGYDTKIVGIEFMKFYEAQDAKNLGFLSAIRMSATFPYITPNVNLPSYPTMEIMDAGVSDNYGLVDAVKYTHTFKEWIDKNTSGVVFMLIRDSPRQIPIEKKSKQTFFDKVFNPIGTLYANWDYIQDNNNEYLLEYCKSFIHVPMDVVEFQYSPVPTSWSETTPTSKETDDYIIQIWKERASLSWHLTAKERQSIKNTIYTPQNKVQFQKLKDIFCNIPQ
ncbi:MAG: patatin-like phospholipase family protein [Cytophagales bacterium]|nr:patatin-like phospholipase family protein [Cytophagales bacterium]